MKLKIQLAVVPSVMLLAWTVQVAAQDLPVLGQGNLSCTTWAERRAGDAVDAATMIAWSLGYITAYSQYSAEPKVDVSGGQRTEVLMKWIDDYCQKNPTDNFYGATAALVSEFRKIDSP